MEKIIKFRVSETHSYIDTRGVCLFQVDGGVILVLVLYKSTFCHLVQTFSLEFKLLFVHLSSHQFGSVKYALSETVYFFLLWIELRKPEGCVILEKIDRHEHVFENLTGLTCQKILFLHNFFVISIFVCRKKHKFWQIFINLKNLILLFFILCS